MPNEREANVLTDDVEMQDADAIIENMVEREIALEAKLKALADETDLYIQGSLKLNRPSTKQLRALKKSQLEVILPAEKVGSTYRKLHCYSLPQPEKGGFLQLHFKPWKFYVRDGYKELYDAVCKKWEGDHFRVCLIGNAGTGKSMFQLFVLKQLLQQPEHERKYDLVVRQVDSRIFVIDLEDGAVFSWEAVTDGYLTNLLNDLEKTLYFFEPGNDADRSPLGVFTPSLSTLSPYERRIKEYSKNLCTRLYFWPWSFSEMWAVVRHSQLSIDFDKFIERYKLFGGIIRNVLGKDNHAEEKLEDGLAKINFSTLTAKVLNVDREDSSGSAVSGFLACYNHRWEGNYDFSKKNLEYTSVKVEDAVLTKLQVLTAEEYVEGVLNRLDGEIIDLSGKMLENAAMELLSCGAKYEWQACAVGKKSWVAFSVQQRTIIRTFTIGEKYAQSKLIIAPTKQNFPAVDFLFSCQTKGEPVVAFQCTWNKTHPLTVRALYEFRCKQMRIPDTQIVNIYLVSPDNETLYQSQTKSIFLDGSLAVDLQWTQTETVSANILQAMWENTNFHVLRPEKSWKDTLNEWKMAKSNP